MKTLAYALLSALLIALPAQAAKSASNGPDATIKNAVNHLQSQLKKNAATYRAKPAKFQKLVEDAVVPHFDTRYIAQLVLGRYWREADEQQRKRFENAFKRMLIGTYANAMLEYYNSVKIDWKPLRLDPDQTDATVHSALLREGKPPIAIGFSMQKSDGQWRIYDITVENISLIDNFRAQVGSEIKRSSIDDVIQRMESGSYSGKVPLKKQSS